MKLVDEEGKPVEADVEYRYVQPNPHIEEIARPFTRGNWTVMTQAKQTMDGSYEGAVLPGPGAVLVKTPRGAGFRPALVDPKAFFAPGRSEWADEEKFNAYGTRDTVAASGGWIDQRDYAAIVLVNPDPDSGPLELSATLVKDKPRSVSLVDPFDNPVVGVKTIGMTPHEYDSEPRLRAASFPLAGLHPNRVQRIKFMHEELQLVGFLLARGDGDSPYTVRMQPWASVAGRLVDEDGNALPIGQAVSDWKNPPKVWADIHGDREQGDRHYVNADAAGRFRFDKLVPGQRYQAAAYHWPWSENAPVFEELILDPGEIRDLGDIRTTLSFEPDYRRASPDDQKATADIPEQAWGEPVNGLRVAIQLQSPALDESQRLRYAIVAENVSDGDIRFGAAHNHEFIYYKIGLVDADGQPVVRHAGSFPDFATHSNIIRCWLKPNERMVISPCRTQVVRLDEANRPISPANWDRHGHFIRVKPGRYSVSADLELGSGVSYDYRARMSKDMQFSAQGGMGRQAPDG